MGYVASAERVVLWDTWPQLRELYCGICGLGRESCIVGYVASAARVVLWDMRPRLRVVLWDTWPQLRELYFVVYGASAERVVLSLPCLFPSHCRVTIITCDNV